MASENGIEAEGTQENDYDPENDSRETESLKVPVNIARTLMCTGH